MRKAALPILALALFVVVLMLVAPAAATSADPVVTITVVGPDGKTVSGAKVTLYDTAGNKYENTTDINGVTKITVPANGTYLVVVKSEYFILDTVDVAGDTSKTVNASAMHKANVTSTPLSVDAKVELSAFPYVNITTTTNVTVYAPSTITVTFPEEITKFPYKYTFDKLKYDGVEKTTNSVSIDMARDYTVTAYYTKTFYMALEYWMVIILAIIIVVALAVAWSAGARTAKSAIEEWRNKSRRFVKKKNEE